MAPTPEQVPDKLEYFDEVTHVPVACTSGHGTAIRLAALCCTTPPVACLPPRASLPRRQVTYHPNLLPAPGPFELTIHSEAPFLGDKVNRPGRGLWLQVCTVGSGQLSYVPVMHVRSHPAQLPLNMLQSQGKFESRIVIESLGPGRCRHTLEQTIE